MTLVAEKLADDMAKLPLSDRATLAHLLIESLDSSSDENAENEWKKVISVRSQQIRDGKVTCRSSFETLDEIREKVKNVSS